MSKNKVVSIEQFSSHPGVPRLLSKSDADQRGRPSRESPSSGDCGLAPAPGPPGGTPESAIQVAAPTETRNAQLAPSKSMLTKSDAMKAHARQSSASQRHTAKKEVRITMAQFIGCDAHKKYSVFRTVNEEGKLAPAHRVGHDREQFRAYLTQLPPASSIAVESSGHWYWLIDEMERAGHRPRLANASEAKRRMGKTKKTDKLDAGGLAILLRNGTLPEVWIPPAELRDQRELLRLRIFLVRLRTRVKNRIHGTLARHNVQISGADLFGVAARLELGADCPNSPNTTVKLSNKN